MTLPARSAYALWAAGYEHETAVSYLEELTVRRLGCDVAGRDLLDVGCGTGRRFAPIVREARTVLGVDLVPAMLRAGARDRERRGRLVAGDLRALPVRSAAFDVTWCRLAIGHVAELHRAYAELARVTRRGGTVLVSDFHPDAVAVGHRRTFRAGDGRLYDVEHFTHAPEAHDAAARAAGLAPLLSETGDVGPEIASFYVRAGRTDIYRAQFGLGLVLVRVFVR